MNILGTIVGTVLVVVGDAIKDYGTRLLFPHGVPRIDEEPKPAKAPAIAQDDLDEPPVGVPPVVLSDAAKEALIKGSMPAPKKPVTPEPVLKGSLKDRLAR